MDEIQTPQSNVEPVAPKIPKESFWHRHLLAELISICLVAATISIVYYLYWSMQTPTIPPLVHHEKSGSNGSFCVQVITPAKNIETGEIKDFPTPCDVPSGWQVVDSTITK